MATIEILPVASTDATSDDIAVTDRLLVCLKAADETIPKDALVKVLMVGGEGIATIVDELHHLAVSGIAFGPGTYRFKRTSGAVGVFGENM
ncbi:MAG TPA: hypothetical protein VGN60_02825 [Devosia sp.]|jgi:hypothetical protein|nr:hypothetical protein [Devosia sp.]